MKVFIGGSMDVSNLDAPVKEKLKSIYDKGIAVLVGDCDGVDKAVQQYFLDCRYENITIYASNGITRNNLGAWPVEAVRVPDGVTGFRFYAAKDEAMAEAADCGLMVWNGDSRGTLNNIINLLKRDKEAIVYFTPQNKIIHIDGVDKLDALMNHCTDIAKRFYSRHCVTHNDNPIDESSRFVYRKGLFWLIPDASDGDSLLVYTANCDKNGVAAEGAPPYNSKNGKSYAHKNTWPLISGEYKNKPWNYYPRGRVEIANGKAKVYHNPILTNYPKFQLLITSCFRLSFDPPCAIPNLPVRFIPDHSRHYESIQHN